MTTRDDDSKAGSTHREANGDDAEPAWDAPFTDDELAEAQRLRDALDGPSEEATTASVDEEDAVQGAALLRSLRAAHDARPIDPTLHDAIVSRALARRTRVNGPPRGVVVRLGFAVVGGLAAAAAMVAFIRPPSERDGAPAAPFLARSTESLLDEALIGGSASARIDRIASARAAELRDNRYAAWGVR